jgi:hypothetical protein
MRISQCTPLSAGLEAPVRVSSCDRFSVTDKGKYGGILRLCYMRTLKRRERRAPNGASVELRPNGGISKPLWIN